MHALVRRAAATIALVASVTSAGCYLAHERANEAGPRPVDAGTDVGDDRGIDGGPACAPIGALVALTRPHPFQMEATEVTREAYARFVACSGPPACDHHSLCTQGASDPRVPMVCVTPCEARAYCAWAGRRLCTDGEWAETCVPVFQSLLDPAGDGLAPGTCVLAAYSDGVWSYVPSHDALQTAGAATACHGAEAPYDRLFDVIGNASEIVAAGDRALPTGSNVASGFFPGCGGLDTMFHVDEAQGLVGFRCCAD